MPRQREFTDVLEKAKQLCAARGKDYTVNERDGFTAHAAILAELFPNGMDFDSVTQEKFVLLNYIIGKVVRYALLLDKGGHEDSAMDISVYGAMLAAMDPDPQAKQPNDEQQEEPLVLKQPVAEAAAEAASDGFKP